MHPSLPCLSVLAIVSLAAAGPQDSPEEPDFRHDLGLAVADSVPIALPERAVLRDLAKATGVSTKTLETTQLFAASASLRGPEDRTDVRLAVLQPAGHPGIRLVLGLDPDGRVLGPSLWGTPEIDEDPTFRWTAFLSQLTGIASRNGVATDEAGRPVTSGRGARLLKKTAKKDRQRTRILVDHRREMRANGQLLTRLVQLQRSGAVPDLAWITAERERYERLEEGVESLAELLSPADLAVYAEQTSAGVAVMAALESALAEGPEAFRAGDFLRRLRGNCGACHSHPTASGAELRDALQADVAALPLPDGLMDVGYDLAPLGSATEEDAALAQDIAHAFRAGVLLLRAATEGD